MEYKGNFIEEMIDRNKVNLYFQFFQKNNPLYKDVNLNEELIDEFQIECQRVTENI